MSSLTRVQKDVIERMRDGWELVGNWRSFELRKLGEASRHVGDSTVWSLVHTHKLVHWKADSKLVLA